MIGPVSHGGLRRTGVIFAADGVGVTRLRQLLERVAEGSVSPPTPSAIAALERPPRGGHGRAGWDSEVRVGRKGRKPAIFVRGCYGFRRAVWDAVVAVDHRMIGLADLGRRS